MKQFFIVVLVIHTADSVIVIVWIIRAPHRKVGGFVPKQVSTTAL
jgi:hypothetical protein